MRHKTYFLFMILVVMVYLLLGNITTTNFYLYLLLSISLFIGFYSLIKGSDVFIDGATGIAHMFNISEYVIGLTLVAFATSLPELAVSVISSFFSIEGIAIGNIIGSNIANIGLILGIPMLVAKIRAGERDLIDIMIMCCIELLLFVFILTSYTLSRYEGLFFVVLYIIYIRYLKGREKGNMVARVKGIFENKKEEEIRFLKESILFFISGIIGVIIGANVLIKASTTIARLLGISEYVIGMTLVAVGTSLPELAATVVAIAKKRKGIVVGNIIGSNIINIVLVLGLASIVRPLTIT
ncbi:MAG TPA: calcium/sodium antiporter, partial [Candidatus Aenigmarchaeota archaeon]|nr:calcium/sodium antiporter [Candidatus Aenigmarchaeota archaeon]